MSPAEARVRQGGLFFAKQLKARMRGQIAEYDTNKYEAAVRRFKTIQTRMKRFIENVDEARMAKLYNSEGRLTRSASVAQMWLDRPETSSYKNYVHIRHGANRIRHRFERRPSIIPTDLPEEVYIEWHPPNLLIQSSGHPAPPSWNDTIGFAHPFWYLSIISLKNINPIQSLDVFDCRYFGAVKFQSCLFIGIIVLIIFVIIFPSI